MDLYYQLDNVKKIEELAIEAGRAAHMARNYAQGFVSLNHPEVATCDNLCGQVEGQLRAMRGHIEERKEIKQIITPVAKTATFMCNIIKPDFISDRIFPDANMDKLAHLLHTVRRCVLRIDNEINDAIVQHSSGLFGEEVPLKFCLGEHHTDSMICNDFDPPVQQKSSEAEVTAQQGNKKDATAELGRVLSNKAHVLQDLCSAHVLCPVQKEAANTIINLAGAAENEARVLIALSVQKHFNEKGCANHLEKLATHVKNAQAHVAQGTFTIPEKRAVLVQGLNDTSLLVDSCRKCITCAAPAA